jgi:folate-binding protein YgfZ
MNQAILSEVNAVTGRPAAIFYRFVAGGVLELRGRDRLALLHRLSTNQLERLTPGSGALTALTTPIGRMIDLLRVAVLPESVFVATGAQKGAQIARHLKRNIFFNDRLEVFDRSAELAVFLLFGDDMIERLGIAPAAADFAVAAADAPAGPVVLQRGGPAAAAALLLVPVETAEDWQQRLTAAGGSAVDAAEWDVRRVERAEPVLPNEISEEFIPLETGLWSAVSFSKGCYVGQEIIARMESRGRLAKQLRRVRLSALPAALPQPLTAAGKDAGILTSAVASREHGLIGLAYVRTAYLNGATALSCGDGIDVQPAQTTAAESLSEHDPV